MELNLDILHRLADPAKAAEAAASGLPTVDLNAFKTQVTKHLEAQSSKMLSSATEMVGGIMSSADGMIEKQLKTVSDIANAAKKAGGNVAGKAANSLTAATALAQLKQAKEHAVSTGNFIPLLAFTQPDLNLKSLPKSLVVLPTPPDLPTMGSLVNKLKG